MKCGCKIHESESESTGSLFYSVDNSECVLEELVKVCETTLGWLNSVRVKDEDDPLQKIQDTVHGPYRELLKAAIIKARGLHKV